MRAEMPAGPEAKARRAAGRARRIVSAALALSLAAALSYGGYGAWACWLRDRPCDRADRPKRSPFSPRRASAHPLYFCDAPEWRNGRRGGLKNRFL